MNSLIHVPRYGDPDYVNPYGTSEEWFTRMKADLQRPGRKDSATGPPVDSSDSGSGSSIIPNAASTRDYAKGGTVRKRR